MAKEILKYILWFAALVAAQVMLFNNLCLFNVAIPLVFIYFIIKLPVTLGVNWVMTLSFLLGLTIDIFSNTQGMNALACTILGALRMPVLHLYFPRDDELSNPSPSSRTLGPAVFMKYLATCVVLYCALFFLIESFTFFNFGLTLMRIAASSALTFVIILAVDTIPGSRR
ncbi:MAG: hypothetical protein NC210_07110 [[Clostridium] fimetarium]|nr:rod shape-determining protein MreD [Alistipes timonensis]MCM1406173.1 hypothetical protein [[Clostridium] fimetarium]